jgi:predicted nucleic acid-binding protein
LQWGSVQGGCGKTCKAAAVRGNLVFDAQIAAVCRENGVDEILTADRDFARFKSLRVVTQDRPTARIGWPVHQRIP